MKTQTMQIILIPTEEATNLYLSVHNELSLLDVGINDGIGGSNQHLYIVSDNEAKDGDWGVHPSGKVIRYSGAMSVKIKKIEATTDVTLLNGRNNDINAIHPQVPQISQSDMPYLIELLNKGITEIEVEMHDDIWFREEIQARGKIKTNPDNTIIIHSNIKQTIKPTN